MLAIKNAKIMTVTNGIIENGTILIDEGIIISAGESVVIPEEAEILDATGKWVTPGLIDIRIHTPSSEIQPWEISLAREFGFTSIDTVLDETTDITVVRPLDFAKSKQECWNLQFDKLALMEQNGIEFCLARDEKSGPRLHLMMIGMAIAGGVSFDAALRALTINPAKLLGFEEIIGSIEAGKKADIAIFDRSPFLNSSCCEVTVISGVFYKNQMIC